MNDDDKKSRKFWKRIINFIVIIMFIGMFPLLYFVTGMITKIGTAFHVGGFTGFISIASVILLPGLIALVYYSSMAELDRRFPPFDAEDSKFPTFRGEINYNTEQARRGR